MIKTLKVLSKNSSFLTRKISIIYIYIYIYEVILIKTCNDIETKTLKLDFKYDKTIGTAKTRYVNISSNDLAYKMCITANKRIEIIAITL